MKADESNYLQEKMNQAKLEEVLPGFDKEAEWAICSNLLDKKKTVFQVKRIAVAAVLLAVVSLIGYYAYITNSTLDAPKVNIQSPIQPPHTTPKSELAKLQPIQPASNGTSEIPAHTKKIKHSLPAIAVSPTAMVTEKITAPICNATRCAIEICVYQTIHCMNKAPAAVADCRILEPNQSGQLQYKIQGNPTNDCNVTVDEIRIKKVNTGEIIVINATSQPATAEEFLNCLSGEVPCDLLAGLFKTSCSADSTQRKVAIDSHYGDVIIK